MYPVLLHFWPSGIHGVGEALPGDAPGALVGAVPQVEVGLGAPVGQPLHLLAALGDANTGVKGFLNQSAVPIVSFVTGNWTQATAAENILTDMNTLVNSIVNTTKELFAPDTMILDNTSFQIANSKRIDPTMEKSVLKSFLENNPYITSVQQWQRCNTASATNGRRIVAYKRDPEVLELVIPQEFEQFPPQAKNLGFMIPTHARVGGVSVRYPLAIAYMDLT